MQRTILKPDPPQWSEERIGKMLANGLLTNRSVLVIPNCHWTGHEADLLVVEQKLRLIDVEIKISRADLRADIKKDKWWSGRPWSQRATPRTRNEWPPKVWKHYYAVPASIWTEKLYESIPRNSGVILLHEPLKARPNHWLHVLRRATPNKEAKAISASDAVDLARLASLRMWTALNR